METRLAQVKGAGAQDVQRVLDRQWHLIREDDATREVLRNRGIDVTALDSVGENPLKAESEGGNRADMATMIIVGIAVELGTEAGSKAVMALWEKVILPNLKKRFEAGTSESTVGRW
ncbi:MAG TPA: hypothetical protein VFJ18_03975 [Pararhizobium sp.]|nr:hypothetical protein [Pararhizobium sp.]